MRGHWGGPTNVLDELGLCDINHDAVKRTGYPVRVLPNPSRHDRNNVIWEVLGHIDVVVEDTCRRLIAHRRILPRLRAWISIPM